MRARSSSLLLILFCCVFILTIGCGGGSKSVEGGPTSQATTPVVTSISPTSAVTGSGDLSLQVTGTGFVSGSVVTFNDSHLTTTFLSTTQLKAVLPGALLANNGSFKVAVINPDGSTSGTSSANAPAFQVSNGVPTIASLSPAGIPAGTSSASVVITGTQFLPSSVALFGGTFRPTIVNSSTQLTMSLTAQDLATPASVDVTVTNPPPGGGSSAATPFVIAAVIPPPPTPPVLNSVTPGSILVGSGDTLVTVSGSGFDMSSTLIVDGFALPTNYISSTALSATLPALDFGFPNPVVLAVTGRTGSSNSISLPVLNPTPVLTSVTPATITAGASDFSLVLNTTGLVMNSQVFVNGSSRASSIAPGPLSIRILASEVAQAGTLAISVVNPAPGGGTSATVNLNVIPGDTRLRTIPLPANALVWDSSAQHIYAAVPASATSNPSSVVAIDPSTGSVVASQTMTDEPSLLSITDDQQFLYVGMPKTGTIARLKLPSLAPDIQWQLGKAAIGNQYLGLTDLEAAPGSPHTVAAAQFNSNGVKVAAIYDDGVARPQAASAPISSQITVDRIQWGADTGTIYGASTTISGGDQLIFSVDGSGTTLTDTRHGVFSGFPSIFYDRPSGYLYDNGGDVIDPLSGRVLAQFQPAGLSFAVDSQLHRAYFIGGNANVPYATEAQGVQINIFDQDRHSYINGTFIPTGGYGGGAYLTRWGAAGLAFASDSNIYLVDGPFVAADTQPSSQSGTYAIASPVLSSLNPESVAAGSADTLVTVNGQGFTAATTMTWNGNAVASTLVSSTQMQFTLPASVLATPAGGSVVATNDPRATLSNPLAFTVTPDLGPGMQLHTLNIAGTGLAWNATASLLYESVPAVDLANGNSIAVIDPVAGTIKSTLPAPGSPYDLAISPDDQYLYESFTGRAEVDRYKLPTLDADITIPLGVGDIPNGYSPGTSEGCDFPVSMAIAPGSPQTLAVSQGNTNYDASACGAVAIFDNATARPQTQRIAPPVYADLTNVIWGADTTKLYAQSYYGLSQQYLSVLDVSSTGVVFAQTYPDDTFLGYRPHFDAGTGLFYGDGGAVTRPSDGAVVGNFGASGLMAPDSTTGRAYFFGIDYSAPPTYPSTDGRSYTLQIFDLAKFTLIDSIEIPNVIGYPTQLVRWGSDGVAISTRGGYFIDHYVPGLTYIVRGPRIAAASGPAPAAIPQAKRIHLGWEPSAKGSARAPDAAP